MLLHITRICNNSWLAFSLLILLFLYHPIQMKLIITLNLTHPTTPIHSNISETPPHFRKPSFLHKSQPHYSILLQSTHTITSSQLISSTSHFPLFLQISLPFSFHSTHCQQQTKSSQSILFQTKNSTHSDL